MAVMYRSPSLENKELMALYGGQEDADFIKDEDCISEECDLDSEGSEDSKGSRGVRSSLSLQIYGLQREQGVHFSNQEYYRRLEELKSTHLRNMAELERMYISQGTDRHREGEDGGLGRGRNKEERHSFSGPTRRLQRINSQEELDFHETSSGSDQSDLSGQDCVGDLGWTPSREQTFERDTMWSPEQRTAQKHFRQQFKASYPKPQGKASRQTGVRVRPNAKVTVPKPFQMMLREEERKKHRVRTRSEVELENMLLKRELEELRECQKKFRASPAPAHTHLPLYEAISRRHRGRGGSNNNPHESKRASGAASPRPFSFLERERMKREAKIVAELGSFGQREERRFRARAVPSSVYASQRRDHSKNASVHHQLQGFGSQEREPTEGQSDQSSDLELEVQQSDASSDCSATHRGSSKSVKKQIELSIEMVKERQWSYIDPFKVPVRNPCSGGAGPLLSNKSDYISV